MFYLHSETFLQVNVRVLWSNSFLHVLSFMRCCLEILFCVEIRCQIQTKNSKGPAPSFAVRCPSIKLCLLESTQLRWLHGSPTVLSTWFGGGEKLLESYQCKQCVFSKCCKIVFICVLLGCLYTAWHQCLLIHYLHPEIRAWSNSQWSHSHWISLSESLRVPVSLPAIWE